MKRAVPYVNESVATRDLKYYIFDWDDNILHMPTKIRMERLEDDGTWRPVELSTATFALVRSDTEHYRAPGGKWREAFRNFEDSPQRDNFLEDTRAALARIAAGEKPGPSFNALRKTLREGRIFAIVTARGHSPAAVERAVRCFIDEVLTPEEREEMMSSLRGYRQWLDGVGDGEFGTDEEELDYYLSMCRYSAVTYEGFAKRMAADPIYQEKLAVAPTAARRAVVLLVSPHERECRRRDLDRLPRIARLLAVLHLDARGHVQDVVVPVEDVVLEVTFRDLFVHVWDGTLQGEGSLKFKVQS